MECKQTLNYDSNTTLKLDSKSKIGHGKSISVITDW